MIGQLNNATNMKGVEYLQNAVPEGYTVELLGVTDEHAMHIDATILPLRRGPLIYNPERMSEAALRKHKISRTGTCTRIHIFPRERESAEVHDVWVVVDGCLEFG